MVGVVVGVGVGVGVGWGGVGWGWRVLGEAIGAYAVGRKWPCLYGSVMRSRRIGHRSGCHMHGVGYSGADAVAAGTRTSCSRRSMLGCLDTTHCAQSESPPTPPCLPPLPYHYADDTTRHQMP